MIRACSSWISLSVASFSWLSMALMASFRRRAKISASIRVVRDIVSPLVNGAPRRRMHTAAWACGPTSARRTWGSDVGLAPGLVDDPAHHGEDGGGGAD